MKAKVLCSACSVLAAVALEAAVDVSTIDPIVPLSIRCCDDLDGYAKDLREASRRFGLNRFIIAGIVEDCHFNNTAPEVWRAFGERIATLREKIADPRIQLGWWCAMTLRQGQRHPYSFVVDDDGTPAKACVCPYDPEFRKMFYAGIEATARAAHPFIVFFEDDYMTAYQVGMNNEIGGCFCPRHMEAFHKATGTKFTAKEVANMFRHRTKENRKYREAFAFAQRDSLVDLSKGIRAALDRVDPKIRTCLCQPWAADFDGESAVPIARALAGPNTRPAIRCVGAVYMCEDELGRLPLALANIACCAATYPSDIEIFHETDSCPHNRFYNSASFLSAEQTAAFMCGAEQSFFYCTQYLDDPFEDPGYAETFRRNRARLAVVKEFRTRSDLVGVRTTYTPREMYLFHRADSGKPFLADHLGRFLSKLGFPFSVKKGPMSVLIGNDELTGDAVEALSDQEILELLKGGVFIDARAAAALIARGFGDLIGVGVKKAEGIVDIVQERMTPASGYARKGRYLECDLLGQGLQADNWLAYLTPGPKTEVWVEYLGLDGKRIAPSVTYFENKLGGRVGVMAQVITGNRSAALFSPRKQELLKLLFDRISKGELPVSSTATPSVWLLAAESRDGKELLFMANNMSGDVRDDLRFEFSKRWTGKKVSRLGMDGKWIPLGTTASAWKPGLKFEICQPEFFLVSDAVK